MSYAILAADMLEYTVRNDFPIKVYNLTTLELNRKLRVREMTTTTTLTTVNGVEEIALPADFLDMQMLYIDRDIRKPLEAVTEWSAANRHDQSGEPAQFSIEGDQLLLNPIPDGEYTLFMRYYAELPQAVTLLSPSNAVLDAYPEIYFWGSLANFYLWDRNNEEADRYFAKFREAISDANKANAKAKYAAPLAAVASVVA